MSKIKLVGMFCLAALVTFPFHWALMNIDRWGNGLESISFLKILGLHCMDVVGVGAIFTMALSQSKK